MNEELIQKSAALFRPGLDWHEVIRPEERDAEVARKINRTTPSTIDLDGAMRSYPIHRERDRQLHPASGGLDLGLDTRRRGDRSDQLHLAARPRRGGQRQHRDRLEQVRLALAVGADEHVDPGLHRDVEVGVVAMIPKL